MSFSQGWDAGFKTLLIYIGTVFLWLSFIEQHLPDQRLSVIAMNVVAVGLGLGFFIHRRRICRAERALAEAEVAAILAGDR